MANALQISVKMPWSQDAIMIQSQLMDPEKAQELWIDTLPGISIELADDNNALNLEWDSTQVISDSDVIDLYKDLKGVTDLGAELWHN